MNDPELDAAMADIAARWKIPGWQDHAEVALWRRTLQPWNADDLAAVCDQLMVPSTLERRGPAMRPDLGVLIAAYQAHQRRAAQARHADSSGRPRPRPETLEPVTDKASGVEHVRRLRRQLEHLAS